MNIALNWSDLVKCRWPIKALLLLACLLPGPIVGYFFHGRALVAEFEQAKARHERVQRQWQSLATETEGQGVEADLRGLQAELAQRRGELFDDDGLASLLQGLARLGADLSFEQVRVGEPLARSHFLEVPIDLRVSGHYQPLQRFLVELAGLDRLVTLKSLSLGVSSQPVAGPLSMQLQIQAYRALSPAPLEAALVPLSNGARDPFAADDSLANAVVLDQAAMVGYLRDRAGQVAVIRVGEVVYPLREGDWLGAERVAAVDEKRVELIAPERLGGVARVLRLGALVEG